MGGLWELCFGHAPRDGLGPVWEPTRNEKCSVLRVLDELQTYYIMHGVDTLSFYQMQFQVRLRTSIWEGFASMLAPFLEPAGFQVDSMALLKRCRFSDVFLRCSGHPWLGHRPRIRASEGHLSHTRGRKLRVPGPPGEETGGGETETTAQLTPKGSADLNSLGW